jgi:hypothetical protein
MKKVLMTLVSVLCIFTACSDMDNPTEPTQELADYTVIIYSMSGGEMDHMVEKMWRETQTWLTDGKIRVLAVNKYGAEGEAFSGEYGSPGEVLAFELDKNTRFETLHQEGADMRDFKLYDPENIIALLNRAKNELPAKEYVLALEGHGGGFNPYTDFPKPSMGSTRGVLSDELLDDVTMDMYELTTAIARSDIKHLKGLVFNNCLMGGMESVMEVPPYADYIIATPFMLTSEELPLIPNLVKNLRLTPDFEKAARQTLTESEARLYEGYVKEGVPFNGNVELLKSAELDGVCVAAKKLASRLCELYPTQQEAIDNATNGVYQFYKSKTFYDLLDYARKLAEQTADPQLTAIREEMDEAFHRAVLQQVNIDLGVLPTLPFYSLSVILVDHTQYHSYKEGSNLNFQDSYELTTFHRLTDWGKWLDTNLCQPNGNPCGQGEL